MDTRNLIESVLRGQKPEAVLENAVGLSMMTPMGSLVSSTGKLASKNEDEDRGPEGGQDSTTAATQIPDGASGEGGGDETAGQVSGYNDGEAGIQGETELQKKVDSNPGVSAPSAEASRRRSRPVGESDEFEMSEADRIIDKLVRNEMSMADIDLDGSSSSDDEDGDKAETRRPRRSR